jgi:broad specificity phosphatase PhoE
LLNEIDVGVITGMKTKEALEKFPAEYKSIQSKNIKDWMFTGGENQNQIQKRFNSLKSFLNKFKNKNILLVGHALINKVILKNVLSLNNYKFEHNSIVELIGFNKKL